MSGAKTVFELTNVVSDGHTFECTTLADPDLIYFDGHFPEQAVLPGVCQVEGVVLSAIRQAWDDLGHAIGMRRLKFRAPIFPGHKISVTLNRDGNRVGFSLQVGEEITSTGQIDFGAPS